MNRVNGNQINITNEGASAVGTVSSLSERFFKYEDGFFDSPYEG